MLGLLLTVVAVSAQSVESAQDSKLLLPGDGPIRSGNYLLTYAHVLTNNVPLYPEPSDAAAGIAPIRSLGAGYVWVSLAIPGHSRKTGKPGTAQLGRIRPRLTWRSIHLDVSMV